MAFANLSNEILISRLAEQSTGGGTSINEAVDMQNFAGVMFLGNVGTTGTALTLTAAGGASTTGFVNLTSGTHATTGGNDIAVLDVYKPRHRYVRCTASTTANARMSVFAIRYGPRNLQSASTNATLVVSPDT
jgi:hypothetical protein